ncbi:MAG: NAD(P)-dependent oxidoreductase [Actinomycetota bacterium]|nr:NAD(P)-dependent oxidoreductase [Actinomycetota bacterium]
MDSQEFIEGAQGHSAVLGASGALVTRAIMQALPELRFIAKLGIGYEVIDIDAATECGIVVTNTPIHSEVGLVAEHTIALMLACIKQFHWYNTPYLRQEGWRNPEHLVGTLEGATVGVIGFGNIGQAVARRLSSFETRILAFDVRNIEPTAAVEQVTLEDLLEQSDVVTLHAPPSPNGPLLTASRLRSMKEGAVLINTARGALVDNVALCELLGTGHLSGVGADVFAPEPPPEDDVLLKAPNTFLTPHVAAWNERVRVEMVELALSSLSSLFESGRPANVVNPEVFEKGLRV